LKRLSLPEIFLRSFLAEYLRIQNLIKSCGYASEEEFKAAIEQGAAKNPEAWKSLAMMWGKGL